MQCNSDATAIVDKRRAELLDLSSYIQTIDNDVTMILQSLQWDRKHLIEASPMTSCRYDNGHRIPLDKLADHEKDCHLRSLGYSKEEVLLPDPPDANAGTLVKLSIDDIANIIDYAAKIDPVFKRGRGRGPAPLSLARLQRAYSADERRAVHDAVVGAAPACHRLLELALPGEDGEAQSSKQKSRAEILAGLRDMKRRRTKYRGAGKTRNYSDVLRDLIATQMEHFSVDGNPTNNSENGNQSKTNNSKQFREEYIKKEPVEYKAYSEEKDTKRNSSKEYEKHQDKSKEGLSHRYNARDETRHSDRSRDKYEERDKHRHDRRDRDKQSSSSKDRSRDRREKEYRSSDRYREDWDLRRDYKEYSSRNERYRRDHDPYEKTSREEKTYREGKTHREEKAYKEGKTSREENAYREDKKKHKRYYDYKQDGLEYNKRIKQEKTE